MKECLHCKKEFEEKKDTAKYCSTSCRVMFNRNKPKPKKMFTSESKLEVLCNTVMDMLSNVKFQPAPQSSFDGGNTNPLLVDESVMFPIKQKIRRSYENYRQLKLDCESIEAWSELKAEILSSDLTQKEKGLLTS